MQREVQASKTEICRFSPCCSLVSPISKQDSITLYFFPQQHDLQKMPSPTEVFRSNANALITGGASGVGLAVAKLCASHDMNLYLVDWNSEALDKVKSSINTKARLTTHKIDVSDLSQWAELKKAVEQDLNGAKLDFLHLNAGIGADSPWRENENWRKILEVNLFGVINGINTFVDHFDTNTDGKQKAIVLTGSKQGITNPPGRPAYNASKAAVNSVAQGLSFEMANVASMTRFVLNFDYMSMAADRSPLAAYICSFQAGPSLA